MICAGLIEAVTLSYAICIFLPVDWSVMAVYLSFHNFSVYSRTRTREPLLIHEPMYRPTPLGREAKQARAGVSDERSKTGRDIAVKWIEYY